VGLWWGLACSTCYSFSIWWHGEAFHELGVQSADVSALLCALPQSSMSLASYQSPSITEVRRPVAVFQLPSWILLFYLICYSTPILLCTKGKFFAFNHLGFSDGALQSRLTKIGCIYKSNRRSFNFGVMGFGNCEMLSSHTNTAKYSFFSHIFTETLRNHLVK
jgi:hypothetical protein